MPTRPRARCAALVLLFAFGAAFPAWAARIARVDVHGLDEVMTTNVVESLSINDETGSDIGERRLDYLLEQVEPETRGALEPFGYYSPTVRVTREGETVRIDVELGPQVVVGRAAVHVAGAAATDEAVKKQVDAFHPGSGEPLDHTIYEASKSRISRTLAERGYFDADLTAHRVEVTRATQDAVIDLQWASGNRYGLGGVTFVQTPNSIIDDSLLHKMVRWDVGTPYQQARVERLRESLQRLDYFSGIDIAVHPEKAVDRNVPIDVTLTPAKRTVYTVGLSYGSDSGAGARLGMDRRWLNRRGHKANIDLDYAQRRKTVTLQYRIPAFAWVDGWYTLAAQGADEQTDFIDNRRGEFVASRSGRINRRLDAVAGLHVLRERWAYAAEDDGDPSTTPDYRYATFFYPQLDATYVDVDDRLMPSRGYGATAFVRGGRGSAEGVSGVLFVQAHATINWYRGLGPRSRFIARGEVGHTWSDAPTEILPPSLRFHAGGERSIRGYGWREVGPRVGAPGQRFAVGAEKVITASAEYEHYFNDSWGAAAFVDTGSAFDDKPDLHTGVGFGVRWKSPVGPVRIDIAHGLNSPDSPVQIYLSLGAEL
ncbi:outer membrane protein assembly factor [Lysobacter sp. TY2-98]|uniref:autotransporter assembly complex protein TamA n=1 Tax=Lysobacter sp. TY2-98 TaxID=2290922 RepID=UPI000E1FC36E|nr:autotransporter assembly complex family protein [Lysobacter sp. TY2-98]AXK73144.1 outer membrane protein assembly factor [Lysobacter sp. TY2-98]